MKKIFDFVIRPLNVYTASPNNLQYQTANQVVCGQASLANGSARESAVVDNSGNLFLDRTVTVTFTIASGTPTSTGGYVNIYVAGSNDGTIFPRIQLTSGAPVATGAGDASVGALGVPPNLRLIGTFGLGTPSSAGERTFRTEPLSVASAFGGNLPAKFSIIIENQTGVAFSTSTTSTANFVQEQGIITTSGT